MPTDPQPLETALYPPGIAIGWEDLTKLEELAAAFIAEHRPQTPTERSLVDALIHTEWMLRRYRWLETELWNTARQSLPPDQRTRSWPGHAFVAQPEIGRIHRMRASAQKSFLDLLSQLRRVKSERVQAPPD